MPERFMVCTHCLKTHFGGSEKCCTHGLSGGILGKGYVVAACSHCGRTVAGTDADHLHCPDGTAAEAS